MAFSLRVAPGVRVRASKRGLRTSVGPRRARVHVGAGRAGVSTGVGPVSYYKSVGKSRSKRPASSGRSAPASRSKAQRTATPTQRPASSAGTTRSLAAAAKAEEAQQISQAIQAILDLHKPAFAPPQRRVAERQMVPALPALIQFREKEAASRVGFFQRAQRKAARAQARGAAQHEHQALEQQADTEQAQRQYAIDEEWHRLVTNDPDTVIGALAEAFEDNEAAAAPLGVEGASASVVVQVPDADVLPDRMPSTTAAGNLSLKKTTKTQRNELYALMVAGYVVVTVKEAFADAPGLREVSIVAVRRAPADAYGRRAPEALMAARFSRESLDGIQWHNADAVQVVNDAAEELILVQKGAAREIKPLDPKMHPDIAAALDVIDLDES